MGSDYTPFFDALIFFLVLQCVAAIGRVYVRTMMVKKFGWDDAAMLATLTVSSAFIIMELVITKYSNLTLVAEIPPDRVVPTINMVLSSLVLYIAASVLLKIALGLLLLRVLVVRWQRIVIYVTMTVSVAYGTFYFFYVLFECGSPFNFPTRIIVGQCLSPAQVNGPSYAHAAWNALADLIFLCLPVALLWKEDMTIRSKISVGLILGVGSVGGVCTIIRIPYINTLTTPTNEFLVNVKTVATLSAIELATGVTCMCLATFKPLVRKLRLTVRTYTSGNTMERQEYCVACGRGETQKHRHAGEAYDGTHDQQTLTATTERPMSLTTVGTHSTWKGGLHTRHSELPSPSSPV